MEKKINFKELTQLAEFLKEHNLEEIIIERKDYKICLKRKAIKKEKEIEREDEKKEEEKKEEEKIDLVPIKAPLVGIFKKSGKGLSVGIKEGDMIENNQIVGYIEAMKIMNEIRSKVEGKVVKILVEDNQPVEYAQVLMLIEPKE